MFKKAIRLLISFILFLNFSYYEDIFANSDILYTEKEQTQTITSGLTYDYIKRLYKSGWKDIHILTADITNPNIKIDVLESKTEYALKKSTQNLIKENGAIAGINGDFFGAGNPKSAMGQIVRNGLGEEAQNYYNHNSNKYAGIFLDKFNNIFIDYMKSNLRLYNSNVNLDLGAKNKITDFKKPVIFTTDSISSTSDLDKRFKNLFKIVVENNVVTQKLGEGQVATIPSNGYVVVMDKNTAGQHLAKFSVGDTINFSETYNFSFRPNKNISEVTVGMSAGGEILREGNIVNQGLLITPKSRQPRTAVATNKDKTKLIMMVVDGRGVSVGATHQEMAQLLLEYGAFDAIHFDGGGSSTIVARKEGENDLSLLNTVSEGSQRSVPNALGIIPTNSIGALHSIKAVLDLTKDQYVMANGTYKIKVYGFDANLNPVKIDSDKIKIESFNEDDATINGLYFTPKNRGVLNLKVYYNDSSFDENSIQTQLYVDVKEGINSIKPKLEKTSLNVSETINLAVVGSNSIGNEMYIPSENVSWTVQDNNVGVINGSTFTAISDGVTTLTATYSDFSVSITISVGETPLVVEKFEQPKQLSMLYFPEKSGVSGGAAITNAYFGDGGNSLLLTYSFKGNIKGSQASYVSFENNPIYLYGEPSFAQMTVKGDSSGNVLKVVIKDNNNKEFIIPVLEKIDSSEWVLARFPIPSDAKHPVRIDKLYVGTYGATKDIQGNVFIDNISSVVKNSNAGNVIGGFKDDFSQNLKGTTPLSNEEDINVFGQTAQKLFPNSKQILRDALNIMQNSARSIVFTGESDLEELVSTVPTIQWQNKYSTSNTSYLSIINLATKNGSILGENPEQWRWLQSYLNSFSKNNILINMDKNIWDSKYSLTAPRENQLLHKILKDFVEQTGKNVIVVSSVGQKSSVYVKDGVRYITLNGLTSSDSSNLNNFKYLKIRASENSLKYDLINLYN